MEGANVVDELADGKRFQKTRAGFRVPAVVARRREAVTVVRIQRVVRLFSEKGARARRDLFGTERIPVRIARGVGERARAPVFAFVAVDEMLERYRTIISVPVEFRDRAVAEPNAGMMSDALRERADDERSRSDLLRRDEPLRLAFPPAPFRNRQILNERFHDFTPEDFSSERGDYRYARKHDWRYNREYRRKRSTRFLFRRVFRFCGNGGSLCFRFQILSGSPHSDGRTAFGFSLLHVV